MTIVAGPAMVIMTEAQNPVPHNKKGPTVGWSPPRSSCMATPTRKRIGLAPVVTVNLFARKPQEASGIIVENVALLLL